MKRQILRLMVAVGFAAAVVGGTITSCEDDSSGFAAPGGPGTAGASGIGVISYQVILTGTQVVPSTNSTGTAMVTVTLNRTTGDIAVMGDFVGLAAPATTAHIHGPAGTDSVGPVLIPLTVTPDMKGTVTGSASMNTTDMNAMLDSQTYVDIHSTYFDQGEIRAQIVQVP